jgi:hypothetical protein
MALGEWSLISSRLPLDPVTAIRDAYAIITVIVVGRIPYVYALLFQTGIKQQAKALLTLLRKPLHLHR